MLHYRKTKRENPTITGTNSYDIRNKNQVENQLLKNTNTSVKGNNDNSIGHETIKGNDSYTLLIVIGAVGGLALIIILIAIAIKIRKKPSENEILPVIGTEKSATTRKQNKYKFSFTKK
ncbi:Hypothetical protein SRAE_1000014300 [Strongyloides ratti]|uniref:Uncharacterized protein n=1 Tax=Strongyloides ratti TaxID=34506 RepID=A0A090L175_STRRB|nr:Hypothetical protein SRAE_1000014300 [Strongyloides ratti]CEF61867.1 Hypothetical protein SRAE_1000014300 [Strongyloides ratti]